AGGMQRLHKQAHAVYRIVGEDSQRSVLVYAKAGRIRRSGAGCELQVEKCACRSFVVVKRHYPQAESLIDCGSATAVEDRGGHVKRLRAKSGGRSGSARGAQTQSPADAGAAANI